MSGHSQFSLLTQRRFLPFFIVQALGAFNDNVYRQSIIALLIFMQVSTEERILYTNLAPALFILPYFLFSATAGQIAEKLEKSKLIRITTTIEIIVMSVAAVGFITHNMVILLIALFCTGMQSTLFGPVKYSILPSVLKSEELTGGNGLIEMGTSMSILAGMMVGGIIFTVFGQNGAIAAAVLVITLAIMGNITSRQIPQVEAGDPNLKINWNPIPESLAILKLTRKQLAVRNSVLGVSWFWFIGTMLTSQLPTYTEVYMGAKPELYVFTLALFSIGTGVGSILCEKLSGRTIEIGLVPLGAFGISIFMLDLYFARPVGAVVTELNISEFMQQAGSWRIIIDLTGIGLFAGFFVVPLFALIQNRSQKNELSRVIAGMNIQNSLFIVGAAITAIILQKNLGWSIPQLFLGLAIANLVVAIYIFTIVPEFLMRFLSWVMVNTLYRLRVKEIEENIPAEGAALIVCNHVSFMDALIISGSISRPIRFVMYYKIFNIPVMRWIFKTAKAIPIAGAKENPDIMQRAFNDINFALSEGELVGIFPEGALTKDGEISVFKTGVEKIVKDSPVPVIPIALKGMWSSMWSKKSSKMRQMRLPRRFRAHIEVVGSPPIPAKEVTAELLEKKVRELRGDNA